MSNGGIKSAISKKGQKLENYLFSHLKNSFALLNKINIVASLNTPSQNVVKVESS